MKCTFKKGTQFHSGEYIGTNEDDELYKGIMVFMITDLKIQLPLAIKAWPEVTEWFSQKILKWIFHVINTGLFLLGLLLQTIIQPM